MQHYIPVDLAMEHYSHLRHHFHFKEYAKILGEVIKPRYATVTEGEALALYDRHELVLHDKVRVIWMHDVERPDDNYLSHEMAEMEHDFGFRSSYNIRMVCTATPQLMDELKAIVALGHEIQYQHEDIVMSKRDVTLGLQLFKEHLAELRKAFPNITAAFGHGVYGSGIDSTSLFKDEQNNWHPERWQACGLSHPFAEYYYFMKQVQEEIGDRCHYFGESRYIGGDEFAQALASTKPGDVVFFLQHPTWWADDYDINELKYIVRESPFFHAK